ncbi:MAG: phosphoglycerate kinase [Alphaproteobacteria bacterium]|nr:phosphoglycerate kinase [Alphaproteobacteria bacterium]
MAAFRTLDDLAVKGRRVLIRLDLNVPMQEGRVTDATRIDRAMPTVRELADKGGRVVILSHFGRPKGASAPSMSLAPLAPALAAALGRPVAFAKDCIGPAAAAAVARLGDGQVLLLENVRFHGGEEANDKAFVAALATSGEVYVNDAFSAAHRAHASTEGLAHVLPAAAGRLMQAELEALDGALGASQRPVMVVVGGAKVSGKLEVLTNLVGKVEVLAIGGGMANTFLFARGIEVGKSLCERDLAETAATISANAKDAGCAIILPRDVVCAEKFEAGAPRETLSVDRVKPASMILDVGPRTVADMAERLAQCRTVLWNGPLGAFELEGFADGTVALARKAAELTGAGRLVSVAGGGDTVAALAAAGVVDRFSYVSTAGGAFLEWLEGKTLPGVAALAR